MGMSSLCFMCFLSWNRGTRRKSGWCGWRGISWLFLLRIYAIMISLTWVFVRKIWNLCGFLDVLWTDIMLMNVRIDWIIKRIVLQTNVEIVVTEGDQEGVKIAALVREIGASTLVVGLHDQSFLYKWVNHLLYIICNLTLNCKLFRWICLIMKIIMCLMICIMLFWMREKGDF